MLVTVILYVVLIRAHIHCFLCKAIVLKLIYTPYLLAIHRLDVVLGVQWLQTLGKVAHDYAQMTMGFSWKGGMVTLRGDHTRTQ
ncbi:unnamed protein product [Cuscuta campestris]|uniref:Uncharacterized protein n=1 Tax=Cuscuta campestris TaxID=132261 RepID=A0A484M7U5_9ASTE|nr:unnamed protein product [Cuscuta campestris]